MYEYTDKAITALYKYTIAKFDELNYIDSVEYIQRAKNLYKKLDKTARKVFLDIYGYYFTFILGKDSYKPKESTIDIFLSQYNPVTKYQYKNEVERKAARFAESMLATKGSQNEKKTAMRYWTNMITQYSIDITDKALISAYKKKGIKKVIWVTAKDQRVCNECAKRDGKVYDINNIPAKAHIGCRCYIKPYVDKVKK